jgi:predicted glycogen debranching enzyme
MDAVWNWDDEWLEADGMGGFASGTVSGRRTRRYHGLLLAATTPPTGRVLLVNGIEASLEISGTSYPISSQSYVPNVVHPDGDRWREFFESEPWPTWIFRLGNSVRVEQELFVPHGLSVVAMRWRLLQSWNVAVPGTPEPISLIVRPLLSGRDYHSLHHENAAFRFEIARLAFGITWRPYDGIPDVKILTNGDYRHSPQWFRNFEYRKEHERGLDAVEDLASPGEFYWDLVAGDAYWIASAEGLSTSLPPQTNAGNCYHGLRDTERQRRAAFSTPLDRAADSYVVHRGTSRTIVAGYPWFTDWGRDTFIAMRGLCIATGALDAAREILLGWSDHVSEGMLPNRFPDQGDVPEFNSVDASLWYIVAVHEYLSAVARSDKTLTLAQREKLLSAICAILDGYLGGTRYGIRVDNDGLLAAGESGLQLTWMDVKIGDWVVTPRIGKPVELQALWLNALWIAKQWTPMEASWKLWLDRGRESFCSRFWNATCGYLLDVVDVNHDPGCVDSALRPNQVLAVGGLPMPLIEGEQARQVLDIIEQKLWTPLGLRTLSPDDRAYHPRYEGGVRERDSAYHQGTVWPWLIGPFVEGWMRVHGNTCETRQTARQKFLQPLLEHLQHAGLGHISEIADAEPPHTPRGCPFQAWSVGEFLRLDRVILTEPGASLS